MLGPLWRSGLPDGGMLAVLGVGFLLSVLAPFVVRAAGPKGFAWLAAYPAGVFAWGLAAPSEVTAFPWAAGVEVALRLDGLSRLFVLLVSGLGALILVYASGYFKPRPNLGRFAGAFIGFMASMLGLVLADDAILLFVFWELTSVTSYLLIGFDHESPSARASAQQAFLVTAAGGLAMLAGFVVLHSETGTFRFSEMGFVVPEALMGAPALLLIVAGCATKSAQFPFHFWLPNAMAAPTPVSAFLHSATMVKAGVYLLARLKPTMESVTLWSPLLMGLGAATALVALALLAYHHDAKKLLAYTTMGALGALVFLLGQPDRYALQAFVALVTAHALYKGALFLTAGSLDKATGTRDVFAWSGLGRAMPWTAFGGALAAGSALGLVGTLGFIGKEYALKVGGAPAGWIVTAAFALGAGLVASRVGILPFVGGRREAKAIEVPWAMWLGPVVLGVAGIGLALSVGLWGAGLFDEVGASLRGRPVDWTWKPFFGFDRVFAASLLLAGLGFWLGWRIRPLGSTPPTMGLDRSWHRAVAALPGWAAKATSWLAPVGSVTGAAAGGRLRDGLAGLFSVVTVVVATGLASSGPIRFAVPFVWPGVFEAMLVVLAGATAVAVVFAPRRVSAICMLGIVGTGVALIFLTHGAPDLALTQLLAELLVIVIAVLVFYRLPKFRSLSSGWVRVRDATIALGFGTVMALLLLAVQSSPPQADVAAGLAARSVPEAYGRNVVNTILVDFRALDTLGEATVLVVAAIGVLALMRLRMEDAA